MAEFATFDVVSQKVIITPNIETEVRKHYAILLIQDGSNFTSKAIEINVVSHEDIDTDEEEINENNQEQGNDKEESIEKELTENG